MILKRIELNGFKSFAGKTEIIVNNGITGIVGPNGSGKSNIADAIRWVLGEQSYKNLRGTKMQDVIFAGTEKRPRKAYCEVTLVFDNTDGSLKSEYSETSISRKLYSSGDSEYYINNNSVRLKDILECIRDTGIGKEGYSIIGQGRIDDILSNKPLQRRSVFEEAAGIMKYRVRKEEAERKLLKTTETLVRVEDILEELSQQVETLREQMEKTKSYLELRDRLKIVDVNLYLYNYERINQRMAKLAEELSVCDVEQAELEREAVSSDELVENATKNYDKLIAENDLLQKEVSELFASAERAAGQVNLINQEIKNINREHERLTSEKTVSDESKAAYKTELDELTLKYKDIELQKATAKESVLKLSNELELQKKLSGEQQAVFAELSKKNADLISSKIEIEKEYASLSADVKNADSRTKEFENTLHAAEAEKDKLSKDAQNINSEIARIADESAKVASLINETRAEAASLKNEQTKLAEELSALRDKKSAVISKLNLLIDMKSQHEGYSDSVRNLFKYSKNVPDVSKRVIGTFAELIKTPKKYETAIEMLLGGALQNIVVQSDNDAKVIIDHLHKNRLGRVTFLPVENLQVSYLNDDELECVNSKGFCAVANEAVEYDENVAPAIEFMLARTVIVEDMDSGIAMMKEFGYSFRVVTLKGDVIRPGGMITGGSKKGSNVGLLSRERTIEEATEESKRISEDISKCEVAVSEKLNKAAECDNKYQELLSELKKFEIARAAKSQELQSVEELLKNAVNTCDEITKKSSEAVGSLERDKSRLKELASQLESAEYALGAVKLEISDAQLKAADTDSAVLKLMDSLNAKKVKFAEISKELERIAENMDRAAFNAEQLNAKDEERALKLTNIENELKNAESQLALAKKAATENSERLEEAKKDIQFNLSRRDTAKRETAVLQKQRDSIREKQAAVMDRRYRAETQKEKLRINLENAENKILEDYSLTYASALPMKQNINYNEFVRESAAIRGAIAELGSVNPSAIEEYKRVRDRVDELTTQKDDLYKAQDDLHEVIDKLVDEMREKFKAGFDSISEGFSKIFSELFGGGKAELRLDGTDVMEAGIEIEAQPPGKRLQSISLLSGGERALTAIALLFAMLKLNPSPVCLLDEIDAALDDANVIRYSDYLTNIKGSTQFLVITHKKRTMSICDTLYGVAMEEKGVSKLVTAKMQDAV